MNSHERLLCDLYFILNTGRFKAGRNKYYKKTIDGNTYAGELDAYRIVNDTLEIYEVKGNEKSCSKGIKQLNRARKALKNNYKIIKTYLVYYDDDRLMHIKLVE